MCVCMISMRKVVCWQLNGFKYNYLTPIILFNINPLLFNINDFLLSIPIYYK